MDSNQHEAVCKYVGKLFLESNFQLEAQAASFQKVIGELRSQITKLEKERDDALKLLVPKQQEQHGNV